MRVTALLSLLVLLVSISACKQKGKAKDVTEKTELPESLDEPKGDVLSFKRYSSGGNLVDAIYFDLVKKTPNLERLEAQLEKFNVDKADSLAAFNNYAGKVESYYNSANQNLEHIEDTVLKERLKVLLAAERGRYKSKANKFETLIKDIDNENLVIKDYYETLKIVATLPVIVKYQNNNIPDIRSIKAVNDQAKSLKAKTIKTVTEYGAAGIPAN
ncbi:MAG: hypothetical protein V4520_05685 [Bacteroidota bacterium]